jgi:SET domain-containing protein
MKRKPPHYRVYARIARSKIHGVGVVAIRRIKKGTHIFYGDDAELVWLDRKTVSRLPLELKKLYKDFAVVRGNRYGCPKNFNLLTPAWYLNHSKHPNVACDANYNFFATKDIQKGEELTVDYDSYSDKP